jgi:hypothetical protein
MKTLQKQFESGDGGFSANPLTYRQINRTNTVAMYERSREGKILDYEVFLVKVKKKGTRIFKQILDDDVEHYPSNEQFGKIAWSFAGQNAQINAVNKFNFLVNTPVDTQLDDSTDIIETVETIETVDQPAKKRGRKAQPRPDVTYPSTNTWTMTDILPLNPSYSQPTMYLFIQSQIKLNKIKIMGTVDRVGCRGKKPVAYSLV